MTPNPSMLFSVPAAMVRTGYVITTPYTPRFKSLEVQSITRQLFRSPEGRVSEVVRFTGYELFNYRPFSNADGTRGGRVVNGWGQFPDTLIRVHDVIHHRDAYLSLTGWSNVSQLRAELEELLASAAPAA